MPTAGGSKSATNFAVKANECVPRVVGPLDSTAFNRFRKGDRAKPLVVPLAEELGGGAAGGDAGKAIFAGAGLPHAELLLPIVRARHAAARLRSQASSSCLEVVSDPLFVPDLEEDAEETAREQSPPCSDINHILAVYDMPFSWEESTVQAAEPVTELQRLTRIVAHDPRFEVTFAALVVLNVAVTAIEIDHRDAAPEFFKMLSAVFCVAFALEVVIRMIADPKLAPDPLLIFDFFIVVVTIFEVVFLESLQNRGGGDLGGNFDFSYLLALRFFRLMRVMRIGRFLGSLEVLGTLVDAVSNAVQPVFFVILLLFLLIFALSLMLTALMPLAAEDEMDERVRRVLSGYYGSLGGSMLSLLEATAGMNEWGPDVLRPLLQHISQRGAGWPAAFSGAMLLAIAGLHLGVTGLVMGIFLDQLCAASQRREERGWQLELREHHGLLRQLDQLFSSLGYVSREQISWLDLSRALERNVELLQELGINMEVAESLFYHLDEDGDGAVTTDAFIFGIFKLRTISKSVDMLGIDYQQEKAIHRVLELRSTLRDSMYDALEKLSKKNTAVLRIREEVNGLRAGLMEIRRANAALSTKRRAFEQRCNGIQSKSHRPHMPHVSVEALRADHALHHELAELEEAVARQGHIGLHRTAPMSALESPTASAVTVDIVLESVREMIRVELSGAGAAGFGAARCPGKAQVCSV